MNGLDSTAERYSTFLKQRQLTAQNQEQLHVRIGYLRLGLMAAAVYAIYLVVFQQGISPLWIFLLVALFVWVLAWHSRVSRRLTLAQRSASFYGRGLARLRGDFSSPISSGERFADPHHLFSGDLDLFGRGSLFERLCHARTREGEATLAAWLLEVAGPPVAPLRLAAAEELSGQIELHEQLAIAGPDIRVSVRPDALRQWAHERSQLPGWLIPVRWFCLSLSLLCIGVAVWLNLWGFLGLAIVTGAAVQFSLRRQLEATLHSTSDAAIDLRILESVLRLIEDGTFVSPFLIDVQSRIRRDGKKASAAIGELAHVAEWIDSLHNDFFRIFDHLFLLSAKFALRADEWRRANGEFVAVWLSSLGEFEAIVSLAAWRRENPATVAPVWVEDAPVFSGRQMRHPLLDPAKVVANDVSLGGGKRLLLVSGSNMSGKSTLLRTAGIQAMLAHAGAHVPAEALTLSRLQIGASIRTMDSLQEGVSRFYAELQRIKAIVDASGNTPPLMFLLDELLSGTNSHDRRVGAEGILRSLIANGAMGFMTTHDLALAEIADREEMMGANVHFDDVVVDGRIHFDYRMKPGVVQTSNALELMRAMGLDVVRQ